VKSSTLVCSKPSHLLAHNVFKSRNNKSLLYSGFAKNRMVAFLPMFWDNHEASSSRIKQYKKSTLLKIPEHPRSHLHRGRSLKSHKTNFTF